MANEMLAAAATPGVAEPPTRRPSALTPLRRRNFSLLFSGQVVSVLGDAAYGLALPWTVLAVTGDPRQMSVVLAAGAVPRVLLLLVGGALADRLSPRLITLLADLGRAVVVGILGVTLFAGLPPLWVVALLAGLEGAGSGLFQPGIQAMIPRTVAEPELPAANGLMQVVQFLSLAFGPLLGGVATAAQASVAFLADAASFLVYALSIFGIRLPARAAATAAAGASSGRPSASAESTVDGKGGMLGDIAAGWRYALGTPLLRSTMAVTLFGNFAFAGTMNVALIVLARNLSPNPVTLGILLALVGFGGILGGLSATVLARVRRRGMVAFAIWTVIAALIVAIPFAAGPAGHLPVSLPLPEHLRVPAVAVLMGLIGLLLALTDTMFLTIMQQRIAPDYLARVFSIQFLAGGILQPLSMVVAGWATASFGPGVAFLGGGVVFVIAILIGLGSRELRSI
jgi:MFS transporter, DHA3 family, macrolide efflux protein